MDTEPKPDEPTEPPKDSKPEDVAFFDEYPIFLNMDEYNSGRPEDEHVDSFTVFMRPLMVGEIQILNRITYLQEKNPDCDQASFLLVNLMVDTLDVTGEEVPVEATSGLVDKMIEYNFPEDMTAPDKEVEKKPKPTSDGLVSCFDFLITHGHDYSEILKYPIPLFNNFITTIAKRLGISKKPEDAAAAFRKLGIPVRPRGNKK